MTDFADEASERTEAQIAAALANRKPDGPKATGYCLECGADLTDTIHVDSGPGHDAVPYMPGPPAGDYKVNTGRRWCNAECRDMWEKRNGR